MENKKVIRFLTKNIPNKEPYQILWVGKDGYTDYVKMFESLSCRYVYWDYYNSTGLVSWWSIPSFVPHLEVERVC